jgi:hypothetical protein
MSAVAAEAADDGDEELLAHNMIEVHGTKAAIVARNNVSAAALAGQRSQARHWIRVLEIIQWSQRDATEDGSHRPWGIPGVGGSF